MSSIEVQRETAKVAQEDLARAADVGAVDDHKGERNVRQNRLHLLFLLSFLYLNALCCVWLRFDLLCAIMMQNGALAKLCEELRSHVKIEDRKFRLETFKKCFLGEEVRFLLDGLM